MKLPPREGAGAPGRLAVPDGFTANTRIVDGLIRALAIVRDELQP